MAGVQAMPFTASELPHSANKERAGFCWQGVPGAASTDIFDQYVELGDSDAESASGQSGGFGRLVQLDQLDQLGFSELPSMTPHVSLDQIMAPGGGAQGGPEAQSRPSELKRDHEVAGASPSPRVCQPSQHLHPLYRAQTDMVLLNSVGDTPGGGSISDSELLNLEGLTMRSPRIQIPHLSTSEPASPPSGAASPRKVSQLGTLCTKIRNMTATLQGMNSETSSEPPTPSSVPAMSTPQPEPAASMPGRPQRPSSPFASILPEDVQRFVAGSEPNLVNGYLRGSFNPSGLLNDQFVHPLQLNGGAMHQTPLSTAPIADGLRLPVSALDGKPLWTTAPGTYLDGGGGDDDANTWWDPSSDAMDTDVPAVSYHAAVNERSSSLNMGVQLHHRQSFEYPAPPGTNDTTNTVTTTIFGSKGMMLHTPQPRGIPSAVLHSDVSAHRPTRADCHHRRPRPRASSLSARHHQQHQYGPGVSPRKGRTVKGSGSASASRIASTSPSPRPPAFAPGPNGSLLHGRSASMQTLHYSGLAAGLSADGGAAIHKRKSWTGRRTSSSSSSLHHQYHGLAMTAAAAAAAAVATTAGGNDDPPSASSPRRRRRTNTGTGSRPASISSSASFPPSHFHPHGTSLDNLPNLEPTTAATTSKTKTACAHPSLHRATEDRAHNKDKDKDKDKNKDRSRNRDRDRDRERDQSKAAAAAAAADKPTPADGFVNYTPQDRALLMTGVAPSGSSKTKARREREAAERQRALRARLARMVALHAAAAAATATAITGTGTGTTKNAGTANIPPCRGDHDGDHDHDGDDGLDGWGGAPGSGSGSGPGLGACLNLGLDLDLNMGLGPGPGPGLGLVGLWNGNGDGTGLALCRNDHHGRRRNGGGADGVLVAGAREMGVSVGMATKSSTDEAGDGVVGVGVV